jgi:hypothetical protein
MIVGIGLTDTYPHQVFISLLTDSNFLHHYTTLKYTYSPPNVDQDEIHNLPPLHPRHKNIIVDIETNLKTASKLTWTNTPLLHTQKNKTK